MTSLVGRDTELSAVAALLRDRQVRLITLTGAPGTGKTRLALGLSDAVADNFPDGVHFVPLAALDRPELVLATIGQVLGVHQVARRPLMEALHQTLATQRLLLVLDNFEHLLSAAPQVVDLLAACGGMTVLATSRAPLRVSGEHRFPVPPLEVPALRDLPEPKALARVPAVRLFVERARAIRPEFVLTEANAAAVAELTVRLDGLPLAIELAAARGALLEPWQLLGRLGGRLALLTDGPRDLPARQRTLEAAVRWSYDLLAPDEQRALRGLAVFAGGCTLDAAVDVLGEPAGESVDSVAAVTPLLEHSLLQTVRHPDDELRLFMLETVREYAQRELSANGELPQIRQKHARYYLQFAERLSNPRLDQPDGPALMLAAEREHDNLRAALSWYIELGEADPSLRLAGALWSFWEKRGHWAEGLRWLEAALALSGGVVRQARADALLGLAILRREQSDFAAAAHAAQEALQIRRQLSDVQGTSLCLLILADIVALAGDPAAAAPLAAEALDLRSGNGEGSPAAWARLVCGYIAAYQADFSGAREHYERGLALRRDRSGDDEVDANLWHGLGTVLAGAGNDAAPQFLEQALTLFKKRGEARGIARALLSLGALLARRGEFAPGRAMLEESLAVFRRLGEGVGVAVCSLLLGVPLPSGMLAEIGEDAVRMWGRLSLGCDMPHVDDRAGWRVVADLSMVTAPQPARSPDGLTQRELEILKLIARRFTNREIAEELVLSVRTVERHVATIYSKTGLSGRRQAAGYALRHGLTLAAGPAIEAITPNT